MDPLTAAAVSGGVGLIGTVMSNQASSAQAQRQMDFQRQMSNTAHQREVSDLKAAGLNPILSALGSGASTPSGAQGTVNDLGQNISKGVETAIAVKNMNKELDLKDATIGNTNTDSALKTAQRGLLGYQSQNLSMDANLKKLQAEVLQKTLPSMLKKAKAEGDYSEINQIMGVIKSGTSSAADAASIFSPFKMKFQKGMDLPEGLK